MKLQELLQLEHEYEIQSVSQYLDLINLVTSKVRTDLNNTDLFIDVFSTFEDLIHTKQPTSRDIKKYLECIRDFAPFGSQIPAANKDYPKIIETRFFYRGVYNGLSFNLLPSALRGNRFGKESDYYHYVKAQCAGDYQDLSQLNTLVKMQHYDCPTRLLDLSSNPLVALYFASKNFGCSSCENANFGYVYLFINPDNEVLFDGSDKAVALSCLAKLSLKDQEAIYEACVSKIRRNGFGAVFDANNNGPAIEKLYHEIRQEREFDKRLKAIDLMRNYYIQPDMTNNRIKLQSGAFLIPGIHRNQLDYLSSLEYEYYIRIKIVDQERILDELDRININEASLFPEADKVAHYYTEKL